MTIVRCDGSTCKFHRFGGCISESLTIRNAEVEFENDKFTDLQHCKTYKYSKGWQQYDADYELAPPLDGFPSIYIYKGKGV